MSLRTLRQRLLAPISFPQYVAIALHEPQQAVAVSLRSDTDLLDVTRNNVVAALRPLTLGIMVPAGRPKATGAERLEFRDRRSHDRVLGTIHVEEAGAIQLGERVLRLLRPTRCSNHLVPAPVRSLYYLRERWKNARYQRQNPYNFQMIPKDLRALFVFYICPRPVVLVSVAHAGRTNLFPMDLIGPTDSPYFTMALRTTSPAVELMKGSRRMALASAPSDLKRSVYDLGKHHRESTIDVRALPFATTASPLFGLPVPSGAPRVREVEVEQVHEVGSHTLFITTTAKDTAQPSVERDALQLFHIHGAYRRYLDRTGAPPPDA